jgi:hypothetical protein
LACTIFLTANIKGEKLMRILTKFVAAIVLAAAPMAAQSASELLQKGIYTQDTVGDLDGAIQIYRQIISSAPSQHEIAAEAQYRLAQALIRKGDLTGAALEFQTLARDYSEYQALISRMAAPAQRLFAFPAANQSAEFDPNKPVTISGAVTQVQWMMPRSWVHVKDGSGTDWSIAIASIQEMAAQQWTRDAVKLGDQLTVNGSLARDGSKTVLAETVTSPTAKLLFRRADIAQTTPAELDRVKMEQQQLMKAEEALLKEHARQIQQSK